MAANFNLSKFQSEIRNRGLARTNRFEVLINPPPALGTNYFSILASIFVEQTSFPLFNISVKPFKIFGPAYQRPITSEYGGEGIPVTFHVERDMNIKRFFDDWMHAVVPDNFHYVNYQEEYVGTVNLRQLDEEENVTYEIVLEEAFPRNMNLIELNNSSTNQTHRLNVIFAYRKWRDITKTQTTPVDIPRSLITPELPVFDSRPGTQRWNWSTGNLEQGTSGSDLPPSA